jgi:hypothetical protein
MTPLTCAPGGIARNIWSLPISSRRLFPGSPPGGGLLKPHAVTSPTKATAKMARAPPMRRGLRGSWSLLRPFIPTWTIVDQRQGGRPDPDSRHGWSRLVVRSTPATRPAESRRPLANVASAHAGCPAWPGGSSPRASWWHARPTFHRCYHGCHPLQGAGGPGVP